MGAERGGDLNWRWEPFSNSSSDMIRVIAVSLSQRAYGKSFTK